MIFCRPCDQAWELVGGEGAADSDRLRQHVLQACVALPAERTRRCVSALRCAKMARSWVGRRGTSLDARGSLHVIVPGRGTLSAFTRLSPGFDAGIPADKSCWTAYSNGKQSSKRGKSFNALQLGYEKLLEIECAPERATRDLPGLGKVKRIRIQW